MAKIDLTSYEWRELVFQGKNKAYGAYTLRGESDKRHNRSMLIVTVVAVVLFLLPTLIKMVTPKQREVVTEVTTLSKLDKAEVKNEPKKVDPVEPPPPLKSSIQFIPPVIKKDEEVKDDEQLKSQDELNNTKVAISVADVHGNDEKNGMDIADVKQAVTQEAEEKPLEVVEQMPTFPGGDPALLKYVYDNYKYPSIASENGVQGKLVLKFVVSKTGSVDRVEIIKSLDPNCDKEAIRVVKTLPKFIPGKQNGVAVAVWFTLPITLKLD